MIKVAVIGAGQRGKDTYADYVLKGMEGVEVVGVAEPIRERREYMKNHHHLRDEFLFESWEQLLAIDKFCDAVLICTNDDMHYEPAKLALEKGYHILLEKPMTNTLEEVDKLENLAINYPNQVFMVCHVLRYTPFFSTIKRLIDEGAIGKIASIQHNENIGYYHMAHSFVRGNWRNSVETSLIILAKSCHDFDILNFLVGAKCIKIASFGNLQHFKKECMPLKASSRCIDCLIESDCPYSALKLYPQNIGKWPTSVITENQTEEGVKEALAHGPYGRCVYCCDNDVMDHQVTILEFENGVSATFNLSAFTHEVTRTIKIMGSKGEIRGHMGFNQIEVYDFLTKQVEVIEPKDDISGHKGHGGGDSRLLQDFVDAVEDYLNGKKHEAKTSALVSLESHRMAFAADESRLTQQVILL